MSFIGTAARAVGLGYRTNPALGSMFVPFWEVLAS